VYYLDKKNKPIYLDNFSTTPCDPLVVEAMLPYFTENFGNSSSSISYEGKIAQKAVEQARAEISTLINSSPNEIIFTSGATESNNLAIFGLTNGYNDYRNHIITSEIEHQAVLEPMKKLDSNGYDVEYISVNQNGIINTNELQRSISKKTLLVSIMTVNNEIGTIQPITQIGKISHESGAVFHTDAAQAVGKIPINVVTQNVDMMSMSAHKMYGPKGVGALYVRDGSKSLPLTALFLGGGQEHKLRSGTLNVPGIVGFGKACEICHFNLTKDMKKISKLRDFFESAIIKLIPDIKINGDIKNRIPGSSSITIPGIVAESIIINSPGVSMSTNSACKSGAISPSHVLEAIGLNREDAYSTLRICINNFSKKGEITEAIKIIHLAIRNILMAESLTNR